MKLFSRALLIVTVSLVLSALSAIDAVAFDFDGDGYEDTYTMEAFGVRIYHPRTGQSKFYSINGSFIVNPDLIADTDDEPGEEIVVIGVYNLIIIDDREQVQRYYGVGPNYSVVSESDTDGDEHIEIVILEVYHTWIVDDQNEELRKYSTGTNHIFIGVADTDDEPGLEVVLLGVDHLWIIDDREEEPRKYPIGYNHTVTGITDTDGHPGLEVVILGVDHIYIIDDREEEPRLYRTGPNLEILDISDRDGEPGAEITFRHLTWPYTAEVIYDRCQTMLTIYEDPPPPCEPPPPPPPPVPPYSEELYLQDITVHAGSTVFYHTLGSITAGPNFFIEPGANVKFQAGVKIRLAPGFVAQEGCEFSTTILSLITTN